MNIKQKLDLFIKEIKDNEDKHKITFNNLYTYGKKMEVEIPDLVETVKLKGKEYKYVSWKWYEYILRKLDPNFWWELTEWSANYQVVKCKIKWLGNEYVAAYAVQDSPKLKDSEQPLNNLGEMLVNEGMRCFAKLCSRQTGLFFHLWIEGKNE